MIGTFVKATAKIIQNKVAISKVSFKLLLFKRAVQILQIYTKPAPGYKF